MSGDGQFVRLPYELIDSGLLSQNELAVYIALLRYRDHYTGRCWPSYSTIARAARVSRSTAMRVMKQLEEMGVVKVISAEPRKPNVIEVALFGSFPDPSSRDDPASTDTKPGVTETPAGVSVTPASPTETPAQCQPDTSAGVRLTPELDLLTRTNELDPENETHEHDVRSDDTSDTPPTSFAFSTDPAEPASAKQITYLADLYVHLTGEAAPTAMADQWRTMTAAEASARITAWLKAMPRGDEYRGPDSDDPAYNRMSTNGQDAADRAMVPREERTA